MLRVKNQIIVAELKRGYKENMLVNHHSGV